MALRRVARVVGAFSDQAMVSGGNFLLMVAVSRCADPADFARFALSYTVAIFVGCLHLALILQPLGMLLPERTGTIRSTYLATLARLHGNLGLIALGVAAVSAWLADTPALIAWTAAATLARLPQEYQRRVAYALNQPQRAFAIDAATYLPLVAAAIALITLQPQAGATLGLVLLTIGNLFGAAVGARLNAGDTATTPGALRPVLHEHWAVGHWLVWGALLAGVADHLHPFLIAGMLGLHETALLAAARSVTGIGNVAINGFDAYAGPRLRQVAVNGGLPALRSSSTRIGAVLLGTLLVVCVPVFLAPEWLMSVIYGEAYRDGWWLLVAMAAIFLLRGLNKLFALVLLALKRPKRGFLAVAINALVTLVAAPMLVQAYGLAGVVVALASNAVVIAIVLGYGVYRSWQQAREHGVLMSDHSMPVNPDV